MSTARTRLLAVSAALCLAATGVGGLSSAQAATSSASGSGTTVLTSDVAKHLDVSTDHGAVADGTPMRIAVAMTVDQTARDAAYHNLYTPGSPGFHEFYTPASFNAAFGVSQAAARRVSDSVTRKGLSVVYASPDGSYLELTGTTKQVEDTFSIAEHTFTGVLGTTFTANTTGPTVPTGVSAVLGLTSLTKFHTPLETDKAAGRAYKAAAAPSQDTCIALTAQCTGILVPEDLYSIYDQPESDTGTGQKVAIFGEGQLDQVVKNLRTFEGQNPTSDTPSTTLPARPVVPVRRVLVGDDNTDNAGQGEWDLDSDASTGMAPNLQELDYYFGSDLSDASIGGTYSAWANDPEGPLTGNSSFGGPEDTEYLGGFILDRLLQQAAMEGRTMFVSSGDAGGSCLPGANGVSNQVVPCVEYPASSTYVVGVGGTVLYSDYDATTKKQKQPASRSLEYSWTYGGGGVSDFEAAPDYQSKLYPAAVTQDAVPCVAGPGAGKICRGVPDVAAVSGDILTNGYAIVNTDGTYSESGGTSLSSPLWAGMWSRVAAAHSVSNGCTSSKKLLGDNNKLGFAQPALYAIGADAALDPTAFFDIGDPANKSTVAGNGQQVPLSRALSPPAGYDFTSGLGTPDIGVITQALDCTLNSVATANVPEAADATTTGTTVNYLSQVGCPANGTVTDPAGDQIPATGTDAYDIRSVNISSDATATTFTGTVTNLAGDPGQAIDYAFEFTYGTGAYALVADTSPAGNTFELYQLAITVTPIGLGVQALETDLGPFTGTFTPASNSFTVTMPFSTFNTDANPKVPYGLGSALTKISLFSQVGPATTALPLNYDNEPIDQANFFSCPYLVPTSTGNAGVVNSSTSTTTTTTAAKKATKKVAAKTKTKAKSAAKKAKIAQPTRTLAFTGLNAALPIGALALLLLGLVLTRRRRRA